MSSKNPGDKRPFIVNILDRDKRMEMDIETWAVSPRKAEANGWFRLMKLEQYTGAVGVFRKKYGERYAIKALDEAGADKVREGDGHVGENPATRLSLELLLWVLQRRARASWFF